MWPLACFVALTCTNAAVADPPPRQSEAIDRFATGDTRRLSAAVGLASYRDWTVACDNRGACTAMNMSAARAARIASADPGDYALPLLRVERRDRYGGWRITVDYRQPDYAPSLAGLSLHVMHDTADRVGPAFPLTQITPGHYALDPEATEQFLNDSRRSSRAAVTMAGHGLHGVMSTAGLTASLTAITARQWPAEIAEDNFVPPSAAFNPVSLTEAETRRLHRHGCNLGMAPPPAIVVAARSPEGAVLTGEPCGDQTRPFILWMVQRGTYDPQLVEFPTPDNRRGTSIEAGLPRASFNLDTGEMTATQLMRPRGDCGFQRRWRWTRNGFELIETRIMPFCAGLSPASWFIVYRSP